jgi:hypothetical protein
MHYLFPSGGDGLHLVVDERGEFREESFMRAMAALSDKPQGGGESYFCPPTVVLDSRTPVVLYSPALVLL